jgi:DNA-directed RNA polymerase specialized sigma24 family protein
METGLVTEIHSSIYDIAPSVANTAYRRYQKFVEKNDVKQECLLWAAKRAEWTNEMLNEPDFEKRKHNEQKIAWQMLRHAERYCRREKATQSGYQTSDEAFYQGATLAQLLPFVIASVIDGTVLEQAQEMIRDGQPKGSSSPAEGGTLLATLIDIKGAYLKLEVEERDVLILRYHESLTLAQIGGVLGCHATTAERKCNNALRSLNEELGGQSPWK